MDRIQLNISNSEQVAICISQSMTMKPICFCTSVLFEQKTIFDCSLCGSSDPSPTSTASFLGSSVIFATLSFPAAPVIFFFYIFYGFLCICTSAAPQRPAHGTVSSQVATHLRTDRVCRVLGRSWIRTQDYL